MEHAEIVALVKELLARQDCKPCDCKTCEVPQMFAQQAARFNEEAGATAAARLQRNLEAMSGYSAIQQKLVADMISD